MTQPQGSRSDTAGLLSSSRFQQMDVQMAIEVRPCGEPGRAAENRSAGPESVTVFGLHHCRSDVALEISAATRRPGVIEVVKQAHAETFADVVAVTHTDVEAVVAGRGGGSHAMRTIDAGPQPGPGMQPAATRRQVPGRIEAIGEVATQQHAAGASPVADVGRTDNIPVRHLPEIDVADLDAPAHRVLPHHADTRGTGGIGAVQAVAVAVTAVRVTVRRPSAPLTKQALPSA